MTRTYRKPLIEALIVVLLFGVALALRLYRLHDFPPGLYVDEAANGVDAIAVLDGVRSIFFERNTGREPLLIYLQAIAIGIFGPTAYALRVPPAVVGALTIPVLYWMVREAFRNTALPSRWLGVWTALFVAFSYWHISLSRLGFRAVLLPLMAAFAFAFLWRAWNRLASRQEMPWVPLIFCGFFTGLTLYTYTAGRLMPIWLALTFAVGSLQVYRVVGWRRLAAAFAIIVGVAILTFAPLGVHFLSHPDQFYGRVKDVSVFNPYFAGDTPTVALWTSIVEIARMFVDRADPNLRHNPAGRPVFDLLMAAWLLAGIVISILRIRVLPFFFAISGFFIFAIPAVITAEGAPHSLRAIGMLPMAYLLAVAAMMVAGQWLASRLDRKRLTYWMPLPFFLFSAVIGVQSYFNAWHDLDRFRGPFLSDYLEIDMSLDGDAETVWIWPLSPNYHPPDGYFYPLEYLNQEEANHGFALVDDETVSQAMIDITEDKSNAYLVRSEEMSDTFAASYIMGDPKYLLKFLLEKYAQPIREVDADQTASFIPYESFELPTESDYSVYNKFEARDVSFANQVKLVGLDLGHAAVSPEDEGAGKLTNRVPSGEDLWIVLDWEALAPVSIDLKTSIVLMDDAGNLAGQVDNLLVGDHYPVERVWTAGEQTHSYHILPIWPAVPPGAYDLYLRVYEDATQRTYPVVNEDGAPLNSAASLGTVIVEPAIHHPVVNPENRLAEDFVAGAEVELLGYDLFKTQAAPGEQLPIVMYWQAESAPTEDYSLTLSMVDSENQPIALLHEEIGGGDFPTGLWRAGEVMRDWKSLTIPATTTEGVYGLVLSADNAAQALETINLGEIDLGEIVVQGRPRVFDLPPVSHPVNADFDHTVRLVGANAPADLIADPGDAVTFDLIWAVMDVPQTSLVRFVHVLNANGQPVTQQDTVPCDGACPTPSWLTGEVLIDPVSVQIPDDLTPGEYRLATGWYEKDTFRRWGAVDSDGRLVDNGLVTIPLRLEVK